MTRLEVIEKLEAFAAYTPHGAVISISRKDYWILMGDPGLADADDDVPMLHRQQQWFFEKCAAARKNMIDEVARVLAS
jgi:hypothetical protein